MKQFIQNVSIVILIFITQSVSAQLYDWRGPGRTGIYDETGLLKQWPVAGPDLLMEILDLGKAYSSATISDNAIYITGRKDTLEILTAISLEGEKIWEVAYGNSWSQSYPDVRCTPTFYNDKIYLVSGMGQLVCIDEKGNVVWKFNHYKKYNAPNPRFGISESPLILDDKIIVSPGGNQASLVALDLNTGKVIWEAEPLNEPSHYVNPLLINYGGKKIIVTLSSNYIFGVNGSDGKLLWKVNYADMNPKVSGRTRKNHAITPIYQDGFIFVCSGYNHISAKLKLSPDGDSVELEWNNSDIDPHHGGVVLLGNYLYSSNYKNNSYGDWVCVDWNTGETKWIDEWYNKGSIISADNMLYIFEEKTGHIGLVSPNSEKLDVVSEFKLESVKGPYWSHPVIRNGKLYVRDGEALLVYNIKD